MDASTQERVLRHVDQPTLVHLASELVKFPSFKTEETAIARWLADYFRERDYRVDLQEIEPGRFQTIATIEGTGGGKSLMLNGHNQDHRCCHDSRLLRMTGSYW